MMGGSVVGICAVRYSKGKRIRTMRRCVNHILTYHSSQLDDFEFELLTSLCRWRPNRSLHRDGKECLVSINQCDMPKAGVKCPASVIVVIPGDRVKAAHSFSYIFAPFDIRVVAFFRPRKVRNADPLLCVHRIHTTRRSTIISLETVPFPEITILHFQVSSLLLRVDLEHHSHHLCIPWPVVFRVRCAVNSDKTFPGLDEFFKRSLLFIVENIPGRIKKMTAA